MNFLFEDINLNSALCGERFFVQCDSRAEALKIIEEETDFDVNNLMCLGIYHDWEAEAMGYDTY